MICILIDFVYHTARLCSSFVPNCFPCQQSTGKKSMAQGPCMRYDFSCIRNNPYLNNNKKLFRYGSSKRQWLSYSVLVIDIYVSTVLFTSARGGSSTGARSLFEIFDWFVFVIFDCITCVYFNCSHQTVFTICSLFSIITTKHRVCVKGASKQTSAVADPGISKPGARTLRGGILRSGV